MEPTRIELEKTFKKGGISISRKKLSYGSLPL
jgi:hypothetical protein